MATRPGDLDTLIPGAVLGGTKNPHDVAFVVARGQGAKIWSTDGREFTDYVLGSGPIVLGHAHPRVVAAIQEQAARGTSFYLMNDVAPQLASRIVQHVPCAEAVKFVGAGAEATFYALRLARAFTGRNTILKFEGAYHGHHDYAQQSLADAGRNQRVIKASSAGIPASISESVIIAPFNDLAETERLALENADDLAAIIVEPVQRAIMPHPTFLPGLRALCDRVGAVLIFDEIVTGFRVARGGAQELFGVKPDLCALGKIVGGGLPLAAIAGHKDLMDLTVPGRSDDGRSVYLSGTLNGNPLSAAAGIATIDTMIEEDGPSRINATGAKLADGMLENARRLSIPFQIIGHPAFSQPLFSAGPIFDHTSYMARNMPATRQLGIEMLKRDTNVIIGGKLWISTAHTDDEIESTCATAFDAMRAVRDARLLE